MLLLKEVYESLKVDGLSIGRPMTFINFWGPNEESVPSIKMDVHDVMKMVKGFANADVCLTGGEPLYQDRASLEDLIEILYAQRHSIMIETNGYYMPTSIMRDLVSMWEIRPNLPSSGCVLSLERLLMFIKYVSIRMQFKFIVKDDMDIAYMRDMLEYVNDYHISISPVEATMEKVNQLYSDTKEMLKGYNVSYLPKLGVK